MPNTPLLQRLSLALQLARADHALAERAEAANTPLYPDELSNGHLSRRRFLGLTAIGLGLSGCDAIDPSAALLPESPTSAKGKNSGARVAVVGAGLAGLTCAYRLRQKGITASVHEADSRLGGRCWTLRGHFAGGQIAEHGGELIDQGHTQIRRLAQELGLTLDNVLWAEAKGSEPFYQFAGAPYSMKDAIADFKTIWQPLHRDLSEASYPTLYNSYTPRGRQLDLTSVVDWIEQTVPGGRQSRFGQLLEIAYVIEYGADAEEQSALNLLYLLGYRGPGQLRLFGPSNEKYHVRGGNDQIVSRLAAQLAREVVTGSRLVAIARTAAGAYDLTFDKGGTVSTHRFDHVVLALPFSMLREVDYLGADFNEIKRTAIEESRMGVNAKLNVQFGRRHWERLGCNGDSFAGTGYQATWDVSRAQTGAAGILVNYTGGGVTLAQVGATAALTQQFLQRIEPVMPGLSAQHNGLAAFDRWGPETPWVKGSYSFWGPGDYTRFAGAERERSFNCYFAGEHTSIDFQGYLNGAVETGERAAEEVIGTLTGKAAA